jgi:extradiol dioxygenase family protein
MSSRFHLAIPVKCIEEAKAFYCNFLGCEQGNFEKDMWQDINFWGNELTLHNAQEKELSVSHRHHVDMADVCVPHFGIHLTNDDFQEVKRRIQESEDYDFLDAPFLRFKGGYREQETFFIRDPSGNAIEIKTMKVPESLWDTTS